MATFWKDLLWPGSYGLADGRKITFRDSDVRNAADLGKRMLRAGLRVPMCWEHDPAANPVYLSRTATHATAWVALGYFGEPTDIERRPDGALWALCNVPDAADLSQLQKIRTVSPRMNIDYRDEKGVLWPGMTLGHIAATPSPVQRHQLPITLSRTVPNGAKSSTSYFLSLAVPIPTTPTDATAMDPITQIKTALMTLAGIDVGECASVEDLAMKLEAMAAANPGDPKVDDGAVPPGVASAPSMPSAMMSRFAVQVTRDKTEIGQRIADLFKSGRITGPARDALATQHKTLNLSASSYRADGSFAPLKILAQIEAYELLPVGPFGKPTVGPLNLSNMAAGPDVPEPASGGQAAATAAMKRIHQTGKV